MHLCFGIADEINHVFNLLYGLKGEFANVVSRSTLISPKFDNRGHGHTCGHTRGRVGAHLLALVT